MIADHRFRALDAVRMSLSVLAHPIQQVAAVPSESVSRVSEYFTSQERLLRENRELKVRVLEQSAAAQGSAVQRAEDFDGFAAVLPHARGGLFQLGQA